MSLSNIIYTHTLIETLYPLISLISPVLMYINSILIVDYSLTTSLPNYYSDCTPYISLIIHLVFYRHMIPNYYLHLHPYINQHCNIISLSLLYICHQLNLSPNYIKPIPCYYYDYTFYGLMLVYLLDHHVIEVYISM